MPQNKKYQSDALRQAAYRQRRAQAQETQLVARALPKLPAIPTMPGYARWRAMIRQARQSLEAVTDEMQSYHDERSASWQDGERGEEFMQHIEAIQDALNSLGDLSFGHTRGG